MPKINISTIIHRSPSVVYSLLKNMESFPSFMRDAKQIRILKKSSKNVVITEWKTDIDGTPVEWVEEDIFDDKKKTAKIRMLKGDFQKYEGNWEVQSQGKYTRLKFEAYLEWGVPNFEKYIGYVLEEKACRSIRSMLWLIRKQAHRGNDG